jgi:preprotein translocase subunit SecF
MEIIRPGTQINFVGYRNTAVMVSLALIVVGIVAAALRGGPNLGIDFSGGSLVHVRFAQATTTQEVRDVLKQADLGAATIQSVQGGTSEYLIRLPLDASQVETVTKTVTTSLAERFGADQVDILRVEAVGPLVGRALREKALLALSFATVMMGVYIWARFQWRFGIGAGVALLHDVLLTVVALIVWNYEFDLTVVAALLTVVGFSVNDTVIVSDRIRENMRKDRRSSLSSIVNRSINETLSRTVLTTGTSLLVVLALFSLGGTVIHGFAFTLLVGFAVGTYSSIFIATPVILFFEGTRPAAGRRA